MAKGRHTPRLPVSGTAAARFIHPALGSEVGQGKNRGARAVRIEVLREGGEPTVEDPAVIRTAG